MANVAPFSVPQFVAWPVTIEVPAPGRGALPKEKHCVLHFRPIDCDAFLRLAGTVGPCVVYGDMARALVEDAAHERPEIRRLLAVSITGWEGVVNLRGAALAFSERRLAELLDYAPFVRGAFRALIEASGFLPPPHEILDRRAWALTHPLDPSPTAH